MTPGACPGSSRRPHRAGIALLILAAVAGPTAAWEAVCDRVVSVGDLHGSYDSFVAILRETRLVDDALRWRGGGACLVQLGDVVDRGAHSRDILDLLIALQRQAPDHVMPLLGNHEVMNLLGDLRFVHPEEFATFAPEETGAEREAGFELFRSTRSAEGMHDAALRDRFDGLFPPGWFAHRRAFSPQGRYGSWLLKRPAAVVLNGTLYIHGGISRYDASRGIPALNRQVNHDLAESFLQREKLIEAGWLDPLTSLDDSREIVRNRLGQTRQVNETTRAAVAYLASVDGILLRPDGPLWNRDLAWADETEFGRTLDEILDSLEVRRIVVAHTPTGDFTIRSRFDGRVFVIDTGAAPFYGGRVSALEIDHLGTVRAAYPGEWEILRGAEPAERIGAAPGGVGAE